MGCHQSVATREAHVDRKDITGDETSHSRRYEICNVIAQGTFGKVWEAVDVETAELRAVKVVETGNSRNHEKAMKFARVEEHVWRRIGHHEHIVDLLSAFTHDTRLCLVMEKCERSLMDALPEIVGQDGVGLRATFRQMLLGIKHVHSRRVVHRDIKPSNFLLGGADGTTVKLCDFGLSAVEPSNGDLLVGSFGTAPYMSPEMAAQTGHDVSTDIWSVGVSAYVMAFGNFPYQPKERSTDAVKAAISSGFPAPTWKAHRSKSRQPSNSTVLFIKAMMQREPCHRYTAEELLTQPYLSGAPEQDGAAARTLSLVSLGSLSTATGGTKGTTQISPSGKSCAGTLVMASETMTGTSSDDRTALV